MTGFMLLSGFVLQCNYKKIDFSDWETVKIFYYKRAIAILPLYYCVALLYSIYGYFDGFISLKESLLLFPVEFLCIQSVFTTLFPYSHNGGTWFISCIMICYAVFPFAQRLFSQITNRQRIIFVLIVYFLLLWSSVVQILFQLSSIYSNPFFRLLEFLIGVSIANINMSVKDNNIILMLLSKRMVLALVLILLIAFITIFKRSGMPSDPMLMNCVAIPCFVSLVLGLGRIEFSSMSRYNVLVYLSSLSFAFYLAQFQPVWIVSEFICNVIGDNNITRVFVSLSYVLALAIILHELVEKKSSNYFKNRIRQINI